MEREIQFQTGIPKQEDELFSGYCILMHKSGNLSGGFYDFGLDRWTSTTINTSKDPVVKWIYCKGEKKR